MFGALPVHAGAYKKHTDPLRTCHRAHLLTSDFQLSERFLFCAHLVFGSKNQFASGAFLMVRLLIAGSAILLNY
jgi:hypothetical protein